MNVESTRFWDRMSNRPFGQPPREEPIGSQQPVMQDDDAAQSLAQIRAILLGPELYQTATRFDHLASTFNEADQATQAELRELDERVTALTDYNGYFRSRQDQFQSELEAMARRLEDGFAELFLLIEQKFGDFRVEFNQIIYDHVHNTNLEMTQLSHEVNSNLSNLSLSQERNFEAFNKQIESRFFQRSAQVDDEQFRSADIFAQGFADIVDRLRALRSSQLS